MRTNSVSYALMSHFENISPIRMNLKFVNRYSIFAGNLIILLCLSIVGCGDSGATVTGKVIYEKDNSPMSQGTVIFVADNGHFAKGGVQGDGSFRLKTGSSNVGIEPGKYNVSITPPDTSAARENGIIVPPIVDARFLSPQTSGLQYDVKPGKNDFTIKVSKPAGG
jgi:hypothetical protein